MGKFTELLRQHRIEAVADVRSSPYSQCNPQFNRDSLQRALRDQGIACVFLGEELGARSSEPECYVNGRADYSLIAKMPAFIRGLDRIAQGAAKKRIAMMCAERDPLDCHRCLLVSPQLQKRGINVQHIHDDGALESQEQAERRLVQSSIFQRANCSAQPMNLLPRLIACRARKSPMNRNTLASWEELRTQVRRGFANDGHDVPRAGLPPQSPSARLRPLRK